MKQLKIKLKKKGGFRSMLLGTLGPSLFGDMLFRNGLLELTMYLRDLQSKDLH